MVRFTPEGDPDDTCAGAGVACVAFDLEDPPLQSDDLRAMAIDPNGAESGNTEPWSAAVGILP